MSEQPTQPPRPRGHVEPTPEARPTPEPPTLRDHLRGPIPGMPPTSGHGPASAPEPPRAAGPTPTPFPNGAHAAPEPPPAPGPSAGREPERPRANPSPNAPIPLFGDRQQGKSTWNAGDLLKPLAAVALILAINLLRLLARGISALAASLDEKRGR